MSEWKVVLIAILITALIACIGRLVTGRWLP